LQRRNYIVPIVMGLAFALPLTQPLQHPEGHSRFLVHWKLRESMDTITPFATRRRQAAYPLIRISPFDTSTVPGAQTWIGFTHEYSGWLVVSVTFSRS
jgi:hypothetical protein